MYLLIVSLPLLSALSAGLRGRFIGSKGAARLTTSLIILTFFICLFAFYEVGLSGSRCQFNLFTWILSENFYINWGFYFDSLTVVMLLVVTSVSSLVHLYSTGYMSEDPHRPRFISYLSLFTFFILILVTADNFIQIFVGWEGVGLCSYLLINFWFTRIQANKAAIKAIIVNRVGDFGLALGIFAIFYEFGSVEYTTVFAVAPLAQENTIIFLGFNCPSLTLICLLLFVGAVGKSAQLGLHTWLPDAMEGPTPVSARIHAATMVTAGVFLLARCSPLFEYSNTALCVVIIFGAITAFIAATIGLLQNDLKRVIAYSTCSQLGYIVFACGVSSYSVAVFHLANHAIFKALLFLGAGSVIHAISDEQDVRRIGGLVQVIPFTYAIIFIGSISLIGFPFITGFYSKDVILEIAFASYSLSGHFAHWLGTFAAFFTAFYSIRLLYLTFLAETNAHKKVFEHAHEGSWVLRLPLFILSIGAVFLGYWTKDIIIGLGSDFWGNALFTHPNNQLIVEAEFIPTIVKLTPVIFSIFGAILGFILYNSFQRSLYNLKINNSGIAVYNFLNRKWFFDKVYTDYISQPALTLGYHTTYKMIDRGLIEILGPFGISTTLYNRAAFMTNLQTGSAYHYAFTILLGVTFFIFILGVGQALLTFIDIRLLIIISCFSFFQLPFIKK